MIKYKKVQKEDIEIEDIICNKCGKSMNTECGFIGLEDAKVRGHYSSTNLKDYHTYSFSLCEECLEQLFNTFKISVDISDPFTE